MKRRVLALLLGLLAVLAAGCQPEGPGAEGQEPVTAAQEEGVTEGQQTAKTGPFEGQMAPDFTLKDLAGTSWTLSELRGSSVALVFWTSW